ncbi:MAG: hypothetical protein ACUVQP_08660 [Bacteroidales bacterium]
MVVKCPKCAKLLEVPKEKLGKKEVCEYCENVFMVEESVIYKEPQPTPVTDSTVSPEIPKYTQSTPPTVSQVSKKKANLVKRIGLTAIIIIGVLFAIGIIMGVIESLTPEATTIVSGTYKIEPNSYCFWKFNCNEVDRLIGSISVPEYDINVWLIKGDREFEAFKRGETFNYIPNVSVEKTSYHSIDCRLKKRCVLFYS